VSTLAVLSSLFFAFTQSIGSEAEAMKEREEIYFSMGEKNGSEGVIFIQVHEYQPIVSPHEVNIYLILWK
jgi:hypothetical protein